MKLLLNSNQCVMGGKYSTLNFIKILEDCLESAPSVISTLGKLTGSELNGTINIIHLQPPGGNREGLVSLLGSCHVIRLYTQLHNSI